MWLARKTFRIFLKTKIFEGWGEGVLLQGFLQHFPGSRPFSRMVLSIAAHDAISHWRRPHTMPLTRSTLNGVAATTLAAFLFLAVSGWAQATISAQLTG